MAIDFSSKPTFNGGLRFGGSGGPLSASPVSDPLAGVAPTGDLAADAAAELSALESGYRERAKMEVSRFKDATDSEFWFAVCFKTREDKEAFLKEFGLWNFGDKYLDGAKVASQLRKGQ